MRVPVWIIPLLIVAITALSLIGARAFTIPSVTIDFQASPGSPPAVVGLLMDGVRCVDTAAQAGSSLAGVAGVVRFVAFASRNQVEVTFDPRQCSIEEIVGALEGPVFDEGTGEFLFDIFRVAEIDGVPVAR